MGTANDRITAEESRALDLAIERIGKVFEPLKMTVENLRDLDLQYGWDTDFFEVEAAIVKLAAVYASLVMTRDNERKEGSAK